MNSHSKTLSKNQSTRSKKFSPEKKANELSKLTPVQFFQKKFGELEVHFHELKKYSPPNGTEQFFQVFVNFKSSIPSFALHAAKILKQRTLSAPLNLKSFEACRVFKDELPLFIQSIYNFQTKIRRLYYKSIFGYFNIMIQNFDRFAEICKQEPHTRTVFLQYEESCRTSLKNIEATLRSFFEPQRFQSITVNESLETAENIKTLGRFYMFDLQRILSPYILLSPSKSPPRFYSQFKAAFEELVPMLSAIPCFRDEYAVLLTKIQPMKDSFDQLYKLIGNNPDAIKLKEKPKLTGEQPPLVIEPVDPIKEPLETLTKELNIHFDDDDDQDNAAKIVKVTQEVKETISSLTTELERVKRRLKILEPLNTKEAIIDRFDQIREFKNEFSKQEEKVRNDFMKNLIFQFKDLAEGVQIDLRESYPSQIRQIVAAISEDQTQKKAEISGLKNQINETKAILSQITNKGNDDLTEINLPSLVRESLTSYRSIQKEKTESKSKILKFLNDTFESKEHDLDFSEFSTEDSLDYISKYINKQKNEINELKTQLSQQEKSTNDYKKKLIESLENIHSSLEKMLNDDPNSIPGNPPDQLSDLQNQVNTMLSKLETKRNENREKLVDFFTKATTALKLPPIDFTYDDTEDAYEKAMTEITDSLTIPTKTDLFLRQPEDQDFKSFLLDLCVRLTQEPKDNFQQLEIEQLKKCVFKNLEKMINERSDLTKFNQFLPKHDDFETSNLILMQLKTALKISDISTKLKEVSDPSEICEILNDFLIENEDLNSDILDSLRKITNLIDLSQAEADVTELKKKIESFKKFISTKDQQIEEITEKMKNCQKHFFDYVDAIKKQTENNQELLQSLQNQEIQSIVDFFSNFEQNDDF